MNRSSTDNIPQIPIRRPYMTICCKLLTHLERMWFNYKLAGFVRPSR